MKFTMGRSPGYREWYIWFAWYPVVVRVVDGKNEYRWWEYVKRCDELVWDSVVSDYKVIE